MTDKLIDYRDLIGVQFEYGGRGPKSFDCWGLLLECERRATGQQLPDYRSPKVIEEIALLMNQEKFRWLPHARKTAEADIPFSEMRVGRALEIRVKGHACHVGYIHRPRHFLHTWEGTGGVTEERIELWRQRILGVYSYGS
jgi:cell wall-associated NlpC family hydrolase